MAGKFGEKEDKAMKATAGMAWVITVIAIVTLLAGVDAWGKDKATTAAGYPAEGDLKPFLGEPKLEIKDVFKGQRLPNVVVATDGSVLAVWGWGSVRVRRSEDGGETWGEEIALGKGLNSGGAVVDEGNGDVLVFTESKHPPAPLTVYRSGDHGKTWAKTEVEIHPDKNGIVLDMCMNEHGITLRRGEHAGRLNPLQPRRAISHQTNPENTGVP